MGLRALARGLVRHDLVDEGDVGKEDASAAVPVDAQLVQGFPGALAVLYHVHVGLVKTPDDLSA